MQEQELKQEPVIFKDSGDLNPDHSLSFYESIFKVLYGSIIKLEAQRGTPEIIFNTKLYTDRNEEIWLSGFTCGKPHLGAGKLCILISMLGWSPRYIPEYEVIRMVRFNNSFIIEFKKEDNRKKIFYFDRGKTKTKYINGET